jgi:hypothetical protein
MNKKIQLYNLAKIRKETIFEERALMVIRDILFKVVSSSKK